MQETTSGRFGSQQWHPREHRPQNPQEKRDAEKEGSQKVISERHPSQNKASMVQRPAKLGCFAMGEGSLVRRGLRQGG